MDPGEDRSPQPQGTGCVSAGLRQGEVSTGKEGPGERGRLHVCSLGSDGTASVKVAQQAAGSCARALGCFWTQYD